MATESYDELEQTSNFDSSIYDFENNEWVQGKPPFFLIQTEYNNAVSSFYDPLGTGFIYMSVKHRSPVFAQKFLFYFKGIYISQKYNNQSIYKYSKIL